MPHLYRSRDRKGNLYPRWRFQYFDWTGKRKTGTGYTTRAETEKLALQVQADQDAIRKGWKPVTEKLNRPRPIAAVLDEYLAWGRNQGGRSGDGWSRDHAKIRKGYLDFWIERLKPETLWDISLAKVEAILRELKAQGRKTENYCPPKPLRGKTLNNYTEALRGMIRWALRRGYLEVDPLRDLGLFDKTPKTVRRALRPAEIKKLLECAANAQERLLFETALCTGFRKSELKALRVQDLDLKNNILVLDGRYTKNRKPAAQPIPPALAKKLKMACNGKSGDAPLLTVPWNTHERIYQALSRAKITSNGSGGKVDFHALRTAYATMVLESGANVREAQTMMRHADPHLTMNVYARAHMGRLKEVAEAVGENIFIK